MKSVLNSLRSLLPGCGTVESNTMVAMNIDEPAKPAEPYAATGENQPSFEESPSKLVRQMIEMADIAAIEAEAEDKADPMESSATAATDPALEALVMEAVKTVRDPEIPVNLVDLGLIYEFNADVEGKVFIEMTLTTPNCPSAADLPHQVEQAAWGVEGVKDVRVKLVFTPPWHQDLMSEEARLELGLL